MQKMSPIPIAIKIRSARIPVRWQVLVEKGKRVFWPQVIADEHTEEIEDWTPLDLRASLFHTFNKNWNEDAALGFLNLIGAWAITGAGKREEWAQGTYTSVMFGHRDLVGLRVLPLPVEEMRSDVAYWYKLQTARHVLTKLQAEFKQEPRSDANYFDRLSFAADAQLRNTLPVSLELGKEPYAVIETITARELLIACSWLDAAGGLDVRVCAECATRFTSRRKTKYCRVECGHVVAVRNYKRKLALEKRKQKRSKSSR
jgi:hypothetical protein